MRAWASCFASILSTERLATAAHSDFLFLLIIISSVSAPPCCHALPYLYYFRMHHLFFLSSLVALFGSANLYLRLLYYLVYDIDFYGSTFIYTGVRTYRQHISEISRMIYPLLVTLAHTHIHFLTDSSIQLPHSLTFLHTHSPMAIMKTNSIFIQ